MHSLSFCLRRNAFHSSVGDQAMPLDDANEYAPGELLIKLKRTATDAQWDWV